MGTFKEAPTWFPFETRAKLTGVQGATQMLLGYARVSTLEQNLDLQKDDLKKAGCDRIFTDKDSGMKDDMPGFKEAFDFLRKGDTLVVWKLDRLGRSLSHLIELIAAFKEKGAYFKSLQENIDTTSSVGKLIFHIFGALAEFERDVIKQRTMAGLASARARGRLGGRPKLLDHQKTAQAHAMHKDNSLSIKDICKTLGISKTTFYRYISIKSKKPC